MAFGRVIF